MPCARLTRGGRGGPGSVHPATAQTAEQLEQQYGREAMAQALEVKRRFDLYGIHFEIGQATIQPQSQSLLEWPPAPFGGPDRIRDPLVFQVLVDPWHVARDKAVARASPSVGRDD